MNAVIMGDQSESEKLIKSACEGMLDSVRRGKGSFESILAASIYATIGIHSQAGTDRKAIFDNIELLILAYRKGLPFINSAS